MHYNQSWAAKGHQASSGRQFYARTMQRASVNIYKTDTSYEMLVFAPGRIREHFSLDVKGNQLIISYMPPEGFPRPEWITREYSRGGFERSFALDDSIDSSNITAKYVDGVLQVSLPVIPGKEAAERKVEVG